MKFTDFSLNEALLKGIESAGYVEATPVQEKVIQAAMEGRDLYVQSQTGTGKTAAYLIGVISQILSNEKSKGKKVLVMVPTRELAVQVEEEAKILLSSTDLKVASFYGGVGYDRQVAALKKGVDFIIGTPGRIIDLNEGHQMDLSNTGYLVLDEADRMFDMGFYPDLRKLLKVLPASEKRETYLFSATLDSYVKNLAWEYTRNPVEITIDPDTVTVDAINQEVLHVSSNDKMSLLVGIISKENPASLIIFCNTKKSCEIISKRLKINGITSEYLIGDLPQKKRLAIMDSFKKGQIKCLVATDVAARGIDVDDLAMVINYDLPNEADNYVHRIGRTARAGKSGIAYTFCSEKDVYSLPAIERYVEKTIPSRVASSEMMAEDKSRDVYIKLDSYHESYNDKSDYGKKKQEQYNSRNKSIHKKGKGRYSEKNSGKASEYKRDRRVYSEEEKKFKDNVDLSKMTSEERMKYYREKYSGTSNSSGYSQKKSAKSQKRNLNKKSNSTYKPAAKQVEQKKKSIFSRIKSLFGKK